MTAAALCQNDLDQRTLTTVPEASPLYYTHGDPMAELQALEATASNSL